VGRSAFDVKLFAEVFVTLVVIMDPIGTIPMFLALTGGRTARARKRLAWQAVLVAIAVIATFALFGQQILRYLGITVPALQGAGGLLLVLVALELLTGKQDQPDDIPDVNVALVPLGTPLLAGPGAIVDDRLRPACPRRRRRDRDRRRHRRRPHRALPRASVRRRHPADHPRRRRPARDPDLRAAALGDRRPARGRQRDRLLPPGVSRPRAVRGGGITSAGDGRLAP
jgi:uncharacterized membrane protein